MPLRIVTIDAQEDSVQQITAVSPTIAGRSLQQQQQQQPWQLQHQNLQQAQPMQQPWQQQQPPMAIQQPPMPSYGSTLNPNGISQWKAGPLSPGGMGEMLPNQPGVRDSAWRHDQRDVERKHFQAQQQAVELRQQIEEKKARDAARKAELKALEEKEERAAQEYNPFGRGGGGAPLRDVEGNIQTNLRTLKPAAPESQQQPSPQQQQQQQQQQQ